MRLSAAPTTGLTALVLATSPGAPLAAQSGQTAALRVRVIDAATGLPIGGAQVGFPELGLFRLANDAGIAQIVGIPPGERTLEATMLGYGKASKTMVLEAHAVATGVIALTSDPIEIEGLTVTTSSQIDRLRNAGFYFREQMGFGYHLGPLEIASTVAMQPSDFFADIPSVEVIQEGFARRVASRRPCVTLSMGPNSRSANYMAIYLDGAPYRDEVDRLPIEMIEAIEVYVGSQVPMQYSSSERGVCGVILLWSK